MRHLPQISGALLLLGTVFAGAREAGAGDLVPVILSISQSEQYNDNVRLLPSGQNPPPPESRGDFSSITNVGASSKAKVSLQEFFADATYGVTRYRTDTLLDATRYSLDAGVNWKLADLCSGKLIAVQSQSQVQFEETLSTFGVNNVVTQSANETARCLIVGPIHAIINSGWTRTDYSQVLSAFNASTATSVSAALEYQIAELNTLRAQETFTRRDFFNRVPGAGVTTSEDQTDYQIYYQRTLSPKTTFIGTIGLTQFVLFSAGSVPPSSSFLSPLTHSLALNWTATPKISVAISESLGVGPPQSEVADFQKNEAKSASVSYAYSPKLSFTGTVSQSKTTNATALGGGITVLTSFANLIGSVAANYRINPFMNATASFRYLERTDGNGLTAFSNLYMIALSYRR